VVRFGLANGGGEFSWFGAVGRFKVASPPVLTLLVQNSGSWVLIKSLSFRYTGLPKSIAFLTYAKNATDRLESGLLGPHPGLV
jgi:hypothetical protein